MHALVRGEAFMPNPNEVSSARLSGEMDAMLLVLLLVVLSCNVNPGQRATHLHRSLIVSKFTPIIRDKADMILPSLVAVKSLAIATIGRHDCSGRRPVQVKTPSPGCAGRVLKASDA